MLRAALSSYHSRAPRVAVVRSPRVVRAVPRRRRPARGGRALSGAFRETGVSEHAKELAAHVGQHLQGLQRAAQGPRRVPGRLWEASTFRIEVRVRVGAGVSVGVNNRVEVRVRVRG